MCKVLDSSINETYTGECVDGLAHGSGRAEGANRYEGDFVNGKKHGQGVYFWTQTGEEYAGQWLNDKQNGQGTLTKKGGEEVDGKWKDAILTTRNWLLHDKNGCQFEFPTDILEQKIIDISSANRPLTRSRIEASTWTTSETGEAVAECDNGWGAGPGTLTVVFGDQGTSVLLKQPLQYIIRLSGKMTKGRLIGQVTAWHYLYPSISSLRESFWTINGRVMNERDYEEIIDPTKKQARLAAEAATAELERTKRIAWRDLLASSDPAHMYLRAVDLESTGDRGRAKEVYRAIIKNHRSSPIAVKAAERIAKIGDAETIEDADRRAEANARDVREASYQQCMNEYVACYNSCDVIRSSDDRLGCRSGCPYCSR